MSDVLPTIDMMPMTTPRIVNPDRAFCSRNVATAIVTVSPNKPPWNCLAIESSSSNGRGTGPN